MCFRCPLVCVLHCRCAYSIITVLTASSVCLWYTTVLIALSLCLSHLHCAHRITAVLSVLLGVLTVHIYIHSICPGFSTVNHFGKINRKKAISPNQERRPYSFLVSFLIAATTAAAYTRFFTRTGLPAAVRLSKDFYLRLYSYPNNALRQALRQTSWNASGFCLNWSSA